jgi:hypothetical protein
MRMSTNSIEKYKEEVVALKAKASSVRKSANAQAKAMQRDGIAAAAAYAYGAWSKSRRTANQAMPTFFDLDPELAATLVLYAGGMVLDGEAGEVAHDAALGIVCGYAMKKAST